MNLRERLLAHLRAPDYTSANEYDLAQRLGLSKKHRAMLAHEVRLVLKQGEFARAQNGRIARRGAETERRRTEARPIFTPTKRGGAAAMSPPTPVVPARTDRPDFARPRSRARLRTHRRCG